MVFLSWNGLVSLVKTTAAASPPPPAPSPWFCAGILLVCYHCSSSFMQNSKSSEAHSKEVHPIPKPSRKMFQVTANMGAAGDPRACLGSYSQSYGTICKSALQSLPVPDSCLQVLAPSGQKH